MAAITELQVLARLQEQLAERDEIIVTLQHVIRDLHHEIENLRVDRAFAAASAHSGFSACESCGYDRNPQTELVGTDV